MHVQACVSFLTSGQVFIMINCYSIFKGSSESIHICKVYMYLYITFADTCLHVTIHVCTCTVLYMCVRVLCSVYLQVFCFV